MAHSETPRPIRESTAIDGIAERWVHTYADLVPEVAIYLGIEGRPGGVADLSPAGQDALVAAQRAIVAELDAAEPADDVDRVTRTDLRSELSLAIEAHEARLHLRDLNVIASPAQELREAFDLMPHDTAEDWDVIARRLRNLPSGMDGYLETLRLGIREGVVPARRQVVEVAEQARRHADPLGFFFDFTGAATLADGGALPDALVADLRAGAEASAAAYGRLAEFLETELAPAAGDEDAVGREVYALRSRHFLGAAIDLDETYEWGIEELRRMVEEQTRIAGEILHQSYDARPSEPALFRPTPRRYKASGDTSVSKYSRSVPIAHGSLRWVKRGRIRRLPQPYPTVSAAIFSSLWSWSFSRRPINV